MKRHWLALMLLAVCALIFLFVYLLWCYAFPLFAMIDLPVWQNVRNALFFAATQRKANLVLLLPLAIAGLCITFLPWSAPLAVLFSLSMLSLMICCIVKPPIDEYVIQPYLKQAEPSADISQ